MINKIISTEIIQQIVDLSKQGFDINNIYHQLHDTFAFQNDLAMSKPLFGYMGGKTRLAPQILPYMADHTVYAEPFAGSLAVLLAKGYKDVTNEHNYREVINDLDNDLINFYQVVINNPVELFEYVENFPYSENFHNQIKTNTEFYQSKNNIEKAGLYFFNILSSFGTRIDQSFARSKLGRNQAATFLSKKLSIKSLSQRLQKSIIMNRSYETIIDEFDMQKNTIRDNFECNTLFFLDPPYFGTTKYNVQKKHIFDYEAFASKVKSIKGYFMLTHYSSEWLLDNFPDTQYTYIPLKHTITVSYNKREGKLATERASKHANQEVLVMNYDPSQVTLYKHQQTINKGDNYQNELL